MCYGVHVETDGVEDAGEGREMDRGTLYRRQCADDVVYVPEAVKCYENQEKYLASPDEVLW